MTTCGTHLGASPAVVSLALFVAPLGCAETPLEVISESESTEVVAVARDASSDLRPSLMFSDASDTCMLPDELVSDSYQIRLASGSCLDAGGATTVRGAPAVSVRLEETCPAGGGALWQAMESIGGSFELRHVERDLNLDIEEASSDNGTRALLFSPHDLGNQRFSALALGEGLFRLSPLHAPGKCLTALGTAVQIWPCSSVNPAQAWVFVPQMCL